MGAGAGALRRDMNQYTTIERHVRLERPNLPYHHHVIIITVSRIPEVEIEELEAASSSDISFDYDYEVEEDIEEWVVTIEDVNMNSDSD